MPAMPTSFFGLFLFSTALSLIATFSVVGGMALVRRIRQSNIGPPRLR
ncbi:MAG: hypothetical protein ABI454_08660 [Sphingomicrobium sp.]